MRTWSEHGQDYEGLRLDSSNACPRALLLTVMSARGFPRSSPALAPVPGGWGVLPKKRHKTTGLKSKPKSKNPNQSIYKRGVSTLDRDLPSALALYNSRVSRDHRELNSTSTGLNRKPYLKLIRLPSGKPVSVS